MEDYKDIVEKEVDIAAFSKHIFLGNSLPPFSVIFDFDGCDGESDIHNALLELFISGIKLIMGRETIDRADIQQWHLLRISAGFLSIGYALFIKTVAVAAVADTVYLIGDQEKFSAATIETKIEFDDGIAFYISFQPAA